MALTSVLKGDISYHEYASGERCAILMISSEMEKSSECVTES